jgi:acetyl esterase/lipase
MREPQHMGPVTIDPSARHEVHVDDVAFVQRGDTTLLARVYRPVARGPWPALVDVHGGAWSYCDRTIDVTYDQALASSGLVVLALDFRQGADGPFPASVRDVLSGVRFVRRERAALDVADAPLGIVGGSSGGHLALLAAICPDDPDFREPGDPHADEPAAVDYALGLWPIADPLARYRYLEPLLQGFERRDDDPLFEPLLLRAAHEAHFADEVTMARASVPRILRAGAFTQLPPIWIAHAEHDRNVTSAMSEELVAACRAAGGAAELEVFAGVGHAFANYPGEAAERCVERMRSVVARCLALPRTTR